MRLFDGSGVGLTQALITAMENVMPAGGSIAIPDVLRPFVGGITCLLS